MSHQSKYSVLIVGQSLAGTILGWQLKKSNISFKIIAPSKGNNSSRVAAGMVNPLVFKRLTQSWMSEQLLPSAQRFYKFCEKELKQQFYHLIPIVKPLSENETVLWQKKQQTNLVRPYVKRISREAPHSSLQNFHAYGTVQHSAFLNTQQFLNASKQYFMDQGCLIEEEIDLAAINPTKTQASYRDLNVDTVVFCDGYKGLNNPFYPDDCFNLCKGQLILIRCHHLSQDYIINRGVFILPVGEDLFKVGSTYEWDQLDEATTEAAARTLTERLNALINVPYEVIEQFAGVRPTVKDRRPLVGFHPRHTPIAFFNGLGTKGVMIAPHFAALLADRLAGLESKIPAEADINRFF